MVDEKPQGRFKGLDDMRRPRATFHFRFKSQLHRSSTLQLVLLGALFLVALFGIWGLFSVMGY